MLISNGKKRGGHLMENLVEEYIKKVGYKKDVNYFKEMYLADIEKQIEIEKKKYEKYLTNHKDEEIK